ncbi:unnamed protein product [Heterobilharzia americana]|nr:unnamed protein product [Heterobilharzia americana]
MSGYHSTFNHNNDDDYQYGLFRKQEVENATKYKNNKEGNGNNDGENVAEKLSYLTKPSPCHNLKRINLATLEPTASGQRTKINTVDTVDDFTGTLSKGKILNAAMVAHLHQLEVRNQKLEKEKTSLEHQLAHVLRRLRTDQVDDEDDNQQFNGGHHSLSNVNHQQESQGVLKVTTTSPVKKKSLNQTVSKPAPIALYDYPNDRKSLMESNSAFSLAEYSSLSDAYEDICLNKNPVDEINGSDLSEMFREKDKTLNDDTELLSSHSNCKQSSDVVYNNFNKNRNNSYEHLHKDHFSESKPLSIEVNKSEERRKSETESPLFSPDDLLIYRPDDYDNTSASQYSSSSISLSPELGIKHKTPLSHRHRFILSRNEKLSSSLSIVSYNSSTDSIVLKENKLDENGLRYAEKSIKHYSTSLPVSPIIPVSWMSKGSFLKSVEKYTKKYDRKIDKSINSSTTQSSIHPASQSSIVQESINGVNNLNVGVLETFEVSNLNVGSYTPQSPMMRPKSRNIVKGPPKVHISRKHMYHPNDSLHFSDTSSSMNPIDRNEDVLSKCSLYPTSVLFESFNGSRSIQSILPQVESSTRPKNQSRQIHSPLLSQPPYSVPANCFGRKQLVVAPQEGLPHTQIKIGSIRDFLNTKLGFSFNTDSQHLINTEKDILVLKYLSSFIKKFEVYTCVSGFAYLLQNIQPNISNLIPILQTPENSTCQEQSSSSNSEVNLIENSNSPPIEIPLNTLIKCSQWLTLKHLIMKQIVSFCFKYPFLKDELYLQLIKQAIFAGLDIKQNSKDAYMLLLKNKTNVKRAFSLLLCTKNQESLDSSNITNQLKHCDNFKQNNRNSYFQIGNQYRQSLIEVSSLLMSSSSTAKLIIPQTNLNSNNNSKRPEYWWPAIAVWECLCLFLTFILPSDPVIGCLECLFNLYLDPVQRDPTGSIEKVDIVDKMKSESIQLKMKFFTEISGYAAFCQDTLKRTKQLGGREHYPSALEVFTLSIRNPYTHVYPFSLPVYLPFGSNYEVVNFHGGSNVHDLHIQIIEKLGLNEVTFKNVVLFALYLCLGQSITDSKKIYLNPTWKICDIISVYEQSTLENLHADQCGPIRIDQISVKLLFKVQTFSWRFIRNLEYEKSNVFLLNFIVHQLHSSIISNQYQIPIRGIDFIDLVAYLCRADYYDYTELQKRQEQITFSQLLENYFPVHWLPKDSTDPRSFIQIKLIILERWTQISNIHNLSNEIQIQMTEVTMVITTAIKMMN